MISYIGNEWDQLLQEEFESDYFKNLMVFLDQEYSSANIFPKRDDIFNALKVVKPSDVKVVILGQDPYHEVGQAHGMAFSVLPGVKVPPSLKNIYKELEEEMEFVKPDSGYLLNWAQQGVLLLNTVLTVREGEANSHKNKGWEKFTDAVIAKINQLNQPIVYMLWGNPSIKKKELLNNPKHLVLTAAHPSPLSAYRGFFGCNHFIQSNEFFVNSGVTPVDYNCLGDKI